LVANRLSQSEDGSFRSNELFQEFGGERGFLGCPSNSAGLCTLDDEEESFFDAAQDRKKVRSE